MNSARLRCGVKSLSSCRRTIYLIIRYRNVHRCTVVQTVIARRALTDGLPAPASPSPRPVSLSFSSSDNPEVTRVPFKNVVKPRRIRESATKMTAFHVPEPLEDVPTKQAGKTTKDAKKSEKRKIKVNAKKKYETDLPLSTDWAAILDEARANSSISAESSPASTAVKASRFDAPILSNVGSIDHFLTSVAPIKRHSSSQEAERSQPSLGSAPALPRLSQGAAVVLKCQ